MDEIDNGKVDLIISGPPYWDYIDYGAYASGDKSFKWQKNSSYDNYLDELRGWYQECYRVLRPGRFCVSCLGTVRRDGKTFPLPFHAVAILEEIGFEFCYEIVWRKLHGGRPHAGVLVQNPYPGYYIPNCRTEYLLVFRKDPSVSFVPDKKLLRTEDHQIKLGELFAKEISNNVWNVVPGAYPLSGKHPCPFPIEIPHRLIRMLSKKEELILDPFMGIGTTARAAKSLDRRFIGYELETEFIQIASDSLKLPFKQRKQTVCRYESIEEEY